jgi:hypothetical protein
VLTDRKQTIFVRQLKSIVDENPDRNNDCGAKIVHTNSVFKPKPALSVIGTFFQSAGHDANVLRDKRASLVDELRRYHLLAVKFTDSGEEEVLQLCNSDRHELLAYPYFLL